MSPANPFTRHVSYSFTVRGEDYSVLSFTDTQVCIEEERKNGQEDCHFYGELNLINGRWVLDDDAVDHLETYMSDEDASAIEAFFNEHGLPVKDSTP